MESYDKKVPHTFSVAFWSDKEKTIPLEPKSNEYPQYVLTNPSGVVIAQGTLKETFMPGIWECQHTWAENSPVSDNYRIDYLMVAKDNRQISKSETFGLYDVEMGIQDRDQRILAFYGQSIMVQLVFDSPQTQVQVTALDSGDNALEGPITAIEYQDQGKYIYRATLSGGIYPMDSTNVLLWTVQENPASIPCFIYQIIDTIGSATVLQINSVRMLVDKFQKAHDSYQGIKDVEIVEALRRGGEIINAYSPFTQWPLGLFQTFTPLTTIHQAASAWWLLNSQYMLEADLEFDFSGQQVNLKYDRTRSIESELQRLWQFLDNTLKNSKKAILRKLNGVGHISTRPQNWRRLASNMVISKGFGPMSGVSRGNQQLLLNLFAGSM